jgi:hypothetical protein
LTHVALIASATAEPKQDIETKGYLEPFGRHCRIAVVQLSTDC